jgi:hypothetical protein
MVFVLILWTSKEIQILQISQQHLFLYSSFEHDILDQLERLLCPRNILDVLGEDILNRQIYSGLSDLKCGSIRDRDT